MENFNAKMSFSNMFEYVVWKHDVLIIVHEMIIANWDAISFIVRCYGNIIYVQHCAKRWTLTSRIKVSRQEQERATLQTLLLSPW